MVKSGCIEWTGSFLGRGYPQSAKPKFGTRAVHRQLMAEQFGEDAIKGKVVRHSCDNPACVNVDHLSLGTQKDNVADMIARGRRVKNGVGARPGEAHHSAKLTEVQVADIRRRLAAGEKRQALADEFGITYWTVRDIQAKRIWRSAIDAHAYNAGT